LPLADEASSGLEGWGSRDLRPRIFLQRPGHLAEPLTSSGAEESV
jgi:hypothetical protein